MRLYQGRPIVSSHTRSRRKNQTCLYSMPYSKRWEIIIHSIFNFSILLQLVFRRKSVLLTMSASLMSAALARWRLVSMPVWQAWSTSYMALDCACWHWAIIHPSCTSDPPTTIATPRWLGRRFVTVGTRFHWAWCPSQSVHWPLCSPARAMCPRGRKRCSPICPLNMCRQRCCAR